MIRSFVSVNTGAVPSENSTEPVTIANPDVGSTCVKTANPDAASTSPAAMIVAGASASRAAGHLGADDERERPGQRPEPGLERRQAHHQLQELREEEEPAEHHEDADPVEEQRGDEGRDTEQVQVDQRIGESALPPDERKADHQTERDRGHRQPPHAVLSELLEAVDHGEDGDERQEGAREVQPPGFGIFVFRQESWSEDQQQHHHRDVHQERGTPQNSSTRPPRAVRSPRPPRSS